MRKFNRLSSLLLTPDLWPLISCLFLLASVGSAQQLTIHHIDVGQGDCIFIQTSRSALLVDAGNTGKGRSVVVPYLKSLKVSRLSYAVATHYHADHIGGLDEVLSSFDVDTIFDRGTLHPPPKTKAFLQYLSALEGRTRITVTPGAEYQLAPDIVLRFVASDGRVAASRDGPSLAGADRPDENSLSVAFTITCLGAEGAGAAGSERGALFTYFTGGDLTGFDVGNAVDLETPVAAVVGHADACKVGHHGSSRSANPVFISSLSPSCVFISVGENNGYGHPSAETVATLDSQPTVRWIYQTEGKELRSSKQRIVGTSVLKFYARGDSSCFAVEWNVNGRHHDCYRCGVVKLTAAP